MYCGGEIITPPDVVVCQINTQILNIEEKLTFFWHDMHYIIKEK